MTESKIVPEVSLVIFDEIQLCPKALTSLKYFQEKAPQYYLACAGSSLGITLASGTSFPVGKVTFLNLYPLTFSEFLAALGKDQLCRYLKSANIGSFSAAHHPKLLDLYLHYTFLGGMPEVIQTYLDSNDFAVARSVQSDILRSYDQDFSKYVPPLETLKIRRIWGSIPAQLAKENKRFVFSAVAKSARAREYEISLQWLIDAGLIIRLPLVERGEPPLVASAKLDTFKIFLFDTGLIGAMVRLPQQLLVSRMELFSQFKGAMFENRIAASLQAELPAPLYYWTSKAQAEVDFVIEHEGAIIPIEAKSVESLRSKSLHSFISRYQPRLALRVSHRPLALNATKNGKILELPIYMIGETKRLLDEMLAE